MRPNVLRPQNLEPLIGNGRKHQLLTMDGNMYKFDMWYTSTCGVRLYEFTTIGVRGVVFGARDDISRRGARCVCVSITGRWGAMIITAAAVIVIIIVIDKHA